MSGCEWLIEAHGCQAESLADLSAVEALFRRLIRAMKLHPVGEPAWHQFPGTGGITGICLLEESHLACHTFPEHGSLCLNVFCCRERPDGPFGEELEDVFGAQRVTIRKVARAYA